MQKTNGYRRNKADRLRVCDLLALGFPEHVIAERLGFSIDTLRHYYPKELKASTRVRAGRAFRPTDEHRKVVRAGMAAGMTPAEVAELIGPDGISVELLRKYFGEELRKGKSQAHLNLSIAINEMALRFMKNHTDPNRVNVDAAKFILERRHGWKAESKVDLSVKRDLNDFTDEELAAIAGGGSSGAVEETPGEDEPAGME